MDLGLYGGGGGLSVVLYEQGYVMVQWACKGT